MNKPQKKRRKRKKRELHVGQSAGRMVKTWPLCFMTFSAKTEKWLEKQAKKGYFLQEIHGNKFVFAPAPPRECCYLFLGSAPLAPNWIKKRKAQFHKIVTLCAVPGTVCTDKKGTRLAAELNPEKMTYAYWEIRLNLYERYQMLPVHIVPQLLAVLLFIFAAIFRAHFKTIWILFAIGCLTFLPYNPAQKELLRIREIVSKMQPLKLGEHDESISLRRKRR